MQLIVGVTRIQHKGGEEREKIGMKINSNLL